MARTIICDLCGNRIEGIKTILLEQLYDGDAFTEEHRWDFHRECAELLKESIRANAPERPPLPPADPNIPVTPEPTPDPTPTDPPVDPTPEPDPVDPALPDNPLGAGES